MKFFNKKDTQKKVTTKLPMTGKVRTGFRRYCVAVLALTMVLGTVGMIMLGFGIVQVGLSLKSHDPSQRANGFLTLAGGVVITFAKEILTLITG